MEMHFYACHIRNYKNCGKRYYHRPSCIKNLLHISLMHKISQQEEKEIIECSPYSQRQKPVVCECQEKCERKKPIGMHIDFRHQP